MWKECLDADTYAAGPGSTVARVIDGDLDHHSLSGIAGVANVGDDRDWCGHPLAAANWYAFGRLAWDHSLGAATIADEWTRLTFANNPRVVQPITTLLLASREAVVDYMTPLGLHHLMATDNHYGPGPWVDNLRSDWNPVYYHRADAAGLGFDRTTTGSNAVSLYAPPVAGRYSDLAACPENLLLWFHHVPWDYRMKSGRTLWDELCLHYQHGVEAVRGWQAAWESLRGRIDPERFAHVEALLRIQEREARHWRDACLLYFQTYSHRPLPAGVEPPPQPLPYYESLKLDYPLGLDGA
jgi:alpha-glucuronidase